MAIKHWPQENRPREKLLEKGPQALTDAELLAIFLRVGRKGVNAIDLARDLINHFGVGSSVNGRSNNLLRG